MIETIQHGQAYEAVKGGYGGYRARCWYCDWTGPLRPPGRTGKAQCKADYAAHDYTEEREIGPWKRAKPLVARIALENELKEELGL